MMNKPKLKIIPLGGLGEIGKNMMVLEYDRDMIVIDAGLMFPKEEMLGIDLVLPDTSYIIENKEKLRGIVITHGHEDHIGALPFIAAELEAPVYATPLTEGLISVKMKENRGKRKIELRPLRTAQEFSLGCFRIEAFPVCHSIPDSAGLIIHTPLGTVVHSGDFKIDHTPVDGKPTDFTRLAQLSQHNILALLSDSTYAELPGYTPSERIINEALDHVIGNAHGRVIIATFASLISRFQQVIDAAKKHQRKVFIIGKSMVDSSQMSVKMGYLSIPHGILGNMAELASMPAKKIVIMATGSQGEPTSALVRIANGDHHQISIIPGDTVIMSATPIPGNEALINRTIDNLFRQGAEVLYGRNANVHVHGHASQEELKLLINLVKPKYFIPIHGEYRHLHAHASLASMVGLSPEQIFVMEDGHVLEIDQKEAQISAKLPTGQVYVDGLIREEIDSVVLRDRRALAKDGIVIVVISVDLQKGRIIERPDIISRGFVDVKESEDLINRGKDIVIESLNHGESPLHDSGFIHSKVKEALQKFFYEQTKRSPLILPLVVEV